MFLMAGQASAPFGYRLVRDSGRHIFVGMAGKTEQVASLDQQNRVFRGVGGMAGNAFSFRKGLMLDGTASLQIGDLVAFLAKLGAFLSGGKWVWRFSRIMAFYTIKLDHRRVRAGF